MTPWGPSSGWEPSSGWGGDWGKVVVLDFGTAFAKLCKTDALPASSPTYTLMPKSLLSLLAMGGGSLPTHGAAMVPAGTSVTVPAAPAAQALSTDYGVVAGKPLGVVSMAHHT